MIGNEEPAFGVFLLRICFRGFGKAGPTSGKVPSVSDDMHIPSFALTLFEVGSGDFFSVEASEGSAFFDAGENGRNVGYI